MAAPKKQPPIQSPLVGAFNNIVNINRSRTAMRSTQSSFDDFLRFMSVEVKNIEAIKLPDDKKVKKLSNINVANTFGRPGSLLSSLFSGALDLGSFLGNTFGGRKPSSPKAGGAIPKSKGIRLGGFKALGVANAAFAGLDFATGLAEGESVSKAAAGAGGALAGSMLGGAIGQALIPVPGVGFMIGSALGGMAGGWLGDRAHEAVTGEGKVKDKQEQKLQELEAKQKATAAATVSTLTFPQVLDKFDSVVYQFERVVANLDMGVTDTPMGYDEELKEDESPNLPDDTKPGQGAESIKYGSGNAEFGETGNVNNSPGWVHGHFQGNDASSVTRDTTMVVKALLKQGSPVYLNPGVDLSPSKEYSDAELTKLVDGARKAHTHSGTGKSIDVFVKKGTKVPVPLTNIGPTGSGFGGYGRGGIAGYIQGTSTWIGHLKPGSKSGLSQEKGEVKSKGKETGEMEGLKPNTDPSKATAKSQTKPIPTSAAKPTPSKQELSGMSTDQLKGILDPTKTAASNPAVFKAAQEARTKGQESGLSGEALEREVMIASIRAKDATSQVTATTQQPVQPQQLQQYPTYSQPSSTVTIIPMMMGAPGGGSQQRPMVVASSGGGGGTTIMPSTSTGQVLNSLMKTVLLTNLSGS